MIIQDASIADFFGILLDLSIYIYVTLSLFKGLHDIAHFFRGSNRAFR